MSKLRMIMETRPAKNLTSTVKFKYQVPSELREQIMAELRELYFLHDDKQIVDVDIIVTVDTYKQAEPANKNEQYE